MKKLLPAAFFIIISFYCSAQENLDTLSANGKIYSLGEVVISENTGKSEVSASEIEKYNAPDVSNSLRILPSVALSTFASRNESTVYIRGFDTRSVPVFIDGIPVYVPYDGYVDLARFTTFDISRIDVSKGFTSINYGANTLGGAINLISMKPAHGIEVHAWSGAMSGKGDESGINIGSKTGRIYVQGGFSYLKRRYIPLSRKFKTTPDEMDHRLDNSGKEDMKINFKLGYLPGKRSEYSINYLYSHGSKGNPVYLGSDETIRPRYWQWPYWDKQSIYYISRTSFGNRSVLKARAYFDNFRNKLSSFDDGTYSSRGKKSSFDSYYDDFTIGSILEFSTDILKDNHLIFSAHIKNDNHSERNNSEPVRHFADNTLSAGIEDVLKVSAKLKLIPSISYNLRQGLQAGDYDSGNNSITDFPGNNSNSVNAQLAAEFRLSGSSDINAYFAYKSRFATMKDRYSYRLGTGIPNPFLLPEEALNAGLSYELSLSGNLSIVPELFISRLFNTIQLVNNVLNDLSQMRNTGKSVFKGFEVAINYAPYRFLEFYGAYSLIERKNTSNPEILFTDVPGNKVFASADLTFLQHFNMIFSGEYNSKRISSSDGIRSAPAYAVGNIRFSADVTKYLKAETGVNNIFDKSYALQEGYPEPGRNFYISLRFGFEK